MREANRMTKEDIDKMNEGIRPKLFCRIFGHWKIRELIAGYQIEKCKFCGKIFSMKTHMQIAQEFGEALRKHNEMCNAAIITEGGYSHTSVFGNCKTGKIEKKEIG